MRYAMVVMLLVGCAVGQGALVGPGSNTFPASREKCLEAVQKHWISADMCSVYGPHGAKPGDCYRVRQDGTMEKVDYCGIHAEDAKNYCCVNDTDFSAMPGGTMYPPEPPDVSAVHLYRYTCEPDHRIGSGTYFNSADSKKSCESDSAWRWTKRDASPAFACADKSRILLTAEDGKHWCHKPQP